MSTGNILVNRHLSAKISIFSREKFPLYGIYRHIHVTTHTHTHAHTHARTHTQTHTHTHEHAHTHKCITHKHKHVNTCVVMESILIGNPSISVPSRPLMKCTSPLAVPINTSNTSLVLRLSGVGGARTYAGCSAPYIQRCYVLTTHAHTHTPTHTS